MPKFNRPDNSVKIRADITSKMLKVYRTLYIDRGLLKCDFCEAVGVTAHNYSKYEKGELSCSIEIAYHLAKTFNVSLDWLFLGDPSSSVVFSK